MVVTRSKSGSADPEKPEENISQGAATYSPSSITGQKRSRDYGEELKGLTPDRDLEMSPSAKRSRRDSAAVQVEVTQAAGSDDGEIVETTAPAQVIIPPTGAANQQFEAQSLPAPATNEHPEISVPKTISPSNGESSVPEQGNATDSTTEKGFRSTTDLDEGDHGQSEELTAVLPSAQTEVESAQTAAPNGWNQGVGLGLRTSFAAKPPKKVASPASSPGIVSFPMMNQEWKVDTAKFEPLICDKELDHAGVFKPHFWKKWIKDNLERVVQVLEENNDFSFALMPKPSVKPKLVRNAMICLVHPTGGILQGTKKDKNAARTVAQPLFDEITLKMIDKKLKRKAAQQQVSTMTNSGGPPVADAVAAPTAVSESKSGSPDNGESSGLDPGSLEADDMEPGEIESDDASELSADEIEQREIYFPGTEQYRVFCTHCTSIKHSSRKCPQLSCRFCGSREHSRFGCPSRQRCAKCHQIGHAKSACQEKLSLAKEERSPCALCGASHTEDECVEVWKSFNPAEVEIRKVKAIPSFCYVCGLEGHYGPECGLSAKGKKTAPDLSIWSTAIRDQYVDEASPNVAIAWLGVDADQSGPGSNFHIRGQAKKTSHVYFVSSDDSDDGFIHEPVQKAPARGNIQINTNASRSAPPKRGGFSSLRRQDNTRRQGQREFSPPPPPPPEYFPPPGSWQPPLPVGPPPPAMPPAYTFQGNPAPLSQAPPGTLPPRPGGNQGFRIASGSSQNGSRRGRGKPRRQNK